MSKFLSKLKIEAEKFALYSQEHIDLAAFTEKDPSGIKVIREPYPHVVIHDFFKPLIYRDLSKRFNEVKRRGLLDQERAADQFFPFDAKLNYDGHLHIPAPTLDPLDPMRVFYSLEWNWFFSKLFRQFTTFETAVALHHHGLENRTGFVHHDFADKQFSADDRLPNGVVGLETLKPGSYPRRRIISLLYYLNNDGWKPGDGGETGLYSADGKQLIKTIPPINNSLFAFQISPKSMHAFQQNHKERNCIIQWFHLPAELL